MRPCPPCQPLGTDVPRTYPASRSCPRPRLPRHMTGSITITTAEDFSCWAAPRQVSVRLRGDDTHRRHLHSAHACHDPSAGPATPGLPPQLRSYSALARPGRCPLPAPAPALTGTCRGNPTRPRAGPDQGLEDLVGGLGSDSPSNPNRRAGSDPGLSAAAAGTAVARADRGVEHASRIKEDRPAGRSAGKPRTRPRCPCCRSPQRLPCRARQP